MDHEFWFENANFDSGTFYGQIGNKFYVSDTLHVLENNSSFCSRSCNLSTDFEYNYVLRTQICKISSKAITKKQITSRLHSLRSAYHKKLTQLYVSFVVKTNWNIILIAQEANIYFLRRYLILTHLWGCKFGYKCTGEIYILHTR